MKEKSPVYKRNIGILIIISAITVTVVIVLIHKSIINVSEIAMLGKELQYNVMNFSGVLAGFMFTSISILISTIDKARIKRLWEHHYLDNLYYCAFISIIANIINAILALVFVCCSFDFKMLNFILQSFS